MSSLRTRTVLAVAALLLGACQTTETRRPIAATGEIEVGTPARCWEVVAGASEPAGLLVLFEGSSPETAHYMVRNIWHQDLGLIDAYGRAYRYLPHHKSPAWVGTGTVQEGVARILERADCALFEVPFGDAQVLEAASERDPSETGDAD